MIGPPSIISSAGMSGAYRYWLKRNWADGPCVIWVMLNPSTADGRDDDATIRKCIGFSQRWGFGQLKVVNLFGFRSTAPAGLTVAADPVGPDNDLHIQIAASEAQEIVVAWGGGVPKLAVERAQVVLGLLGDKEVRHLGLTASLQPKHPLMLAYATQRHDIEASQLRGVIRERFRRA